MINNKSAIIFFICLCFVIAAAQRMAVWLVRDCGLQTY
jgi:hypothetical protein